jgi:hypothetical protein
MNMFKPTAGYMPTSEGIKATKALLQKVHQRLA